MMNMMIARKLQWVAVALMVLTSVWSALGQESTSTPLERFFFDSVPVIEVVNFEASPTVLTYLMETVWNSSETDRTLLEFRVMQPLVPEDDPRGVPDSTRLSAWHLWTSQSSYASRAALYRYTEQPSLAASVRSAQYMSRISDLGGCHYCESSPAYTPLPRGKLPVMGLFETSQQQGAYPLESTFAIYLAQQTSQEKGTLDFVPIHAFSSEPTSTRLPYLFDFLNFWEMYSEPSAFDYHITNVNETLRPMAPSWSIDMGNVGKHWYSVLKYTSGCYKC
mmetsp:Transcript_43582/g.109978  ORF Transcript_43582/g.109978 Transcript_43582/m.109978 type:complete len:278 (-) Transcript_43582:8-841(-)|eukprot:CAMPEP_0177629018 /NCGR_PEP_ID=MMETSP0447-20121125/440_1 /TAXON_ID=0 /ORGANISM="Stygamoeba regulata, Strain BSH-02190019" /LENGTH=277 /DNA_ID=CAMNT_0019130303 /DNA_START=30 /DNA_END=863 /DNA_ORIENTATION=+